MTKLILKCPYIKASSGSSAVGYLKYIATRDGVENPSDTKRHLPATLRQQQAINSILKNFPVSKEIYEYEDYIKTPTRENADELILQMAECNGLLMQSRDQYVRYIAKRPRVQKIAEHGLFTDEGVPVILEQVQKEIAKHEGNIWGHIISLYQYPIKKFIKNQVKTLIYGFYADFLSTLLLDIGITTGGCHTTWV